MNYKKLTYLLKVKEQVNDLFVWSIWGDGEQLFCRVQDEKDNVYLTPFSRVFN